MRTSQVERVEIVLPKFWFRLLQRPLAYYTVAALTGVSITFVPLSLFWLGRSGASYRDWRVLACFLVVYLVPLVYVLLGGPVLKEVWKARSDATGPAV